MPVDNELYDRLSDTWWEDAGFLNFVRSAMNPARVGFLERELTAHLSTLDGLTVLDVGCGGGLLSEELAKRGCSVTGVDPSEGSLAVARAHTPTARSLKSNTSVGSPRRSRWRTTRLTRSAAATSWSTSTAHGSQRMGPRAASRRSLPDDTINRTLRSKLLMIKLFQDWKAIRFMEPDLHDHWMFIRPREIEQYLHTAGLEPGRIVGLAPGIAPPRALRLVRVRATGRVTCGDLGRGLRIGESRDRSGPYAGTAAKPLRPS
jgi:2-polyprenyl-6-hydroxyphenyl methylase / 3-demethylubiquinone-9 3-methyltransferase